MAGTGYVGLSIATLLAQNNHVTAVEAIKAVGKAGGYVYIMDVTSGIPYISDTLSKDVTAEVKAQLNKPAAATKK